MAAQPPAINARRLGEQLAQAVQNRASIAQATRDTTQPASGRPGASQGPQQASKK